MKKIVIALTFLTTSSIIIASEEVKKFGRRNPNRSIEGPSMWSPEMLLGICTKKTTDKKLSKAKKTSPKKDYHYWSIPKGHNPYKN